MSAESGDRIHAAAQDAAVLLAMKGLTAGELLACTTLLVREAIMLAQQRHHVDWGECIDNCGAMLKRTMPEPGERSWFEPGVLK